MSEMKILYLGYPNFSNFPIIFELRMPETKQRQTSLPVTKSEIAKTKSSGLTLYTTKEIQELYDKYGIFEKTETGSFEKKEYIDVLKRHVNLISSKLSLVVNSCTTNTPLKIVYEDIIRVLLLKINSLIY